ncbi:MAG: hypothetical protein QME79_03005 [Bacillota bacterium]|nr:hypothetical protein [Bacillota bacterium]
MGHDYVHRLRGYVRDLDEMCATCDRWIADADPPVRRRLIFARRGLGIARLAFLAILGLLGVAALRPRVL